jgi:hypothetical protein
MGLFNKQKVAAVEKPDPCVTAHSVRWHYESSYARDARRLADNMIIRSGNEIRIVGPKGGSKLLARFDTEEGIDHRLGNARMMLAGWLEVMLEAPLKDVFQQFRKLADL